MCDIAWQTLFAADIIPSTFDLFQISVFGTPAEEDGGGKIDMINMGAFEGLDVVFMAHPSQEDATYLPIIAEHEYVQWPIP